MTQEKEPKKEEEPTEDKTEEPKEEKTSNSQTPEPKGDKVFISESELKALEEKIKNVPKDEKEVYEKAALDLRSSIESAREKEQTSQEQETLKKEIEDLKASISSLKETANTPQRRGFSNTPESIFQKDEEGRTGIPRDKMEQLLKETFKK